MPDFITFGNDVSLDLSVKITLNRPLRDIVALLEMIHLAADMSLNDNDDVNFFTLYEDVFRQIEVFGTKVIEDNDD